MEFTRNLANEPAEYATPTKLAEVAKDPKNVKIINNHKVISMDVAVKNDAIFLIPEPKSPHCVDLDPTGKYIIVCGKLDTHASVYDFEKIQKLIKGKEIIKFRIGLLVRVTGVLPAWLLTVAIKICSY